MYWFSGWYWATWWYQSAGKKRTSPFFKTTWYWCLMLSLGSRSGLTLIQLTFWAGSSGLSVKVYWKVYIIFIMPKCIRILMFLEIRIVELGYQSKMFFPLNNTIKIVIRIFVKTGHRAVFPHPKIKSVRLLAKYRRKKFDKLRVNVLFQWRKFFV